MTINKENENWLSRKEDMIDIYCPHCYELHQICFSKLSTDNYFFNPELNVEDAITGFTECSHCGNTIWFDFYPPYTKNPLGTELDIFKSIDNRLGFKEKE